MPPPPLPQAEPTASTSVKVKVKPPKSVTIDPAPAPVMPPPPLPVTKKASIATPPATEEKKEKQAKKRKEPGEARKSDLDDLLGAEVDAMGSKVVSNDPLTDLLEEPKQPTKKSKLPVSSKVSKGASKELSAAPSSSNEKPSVKKAKIKVPSASSSSPVPRPPVPTEQPSVSQALGPPPIAPSTVISPQPQPPSDLPPTKSNSMPFKTKRAKALLTMLQKEPSAILVRYVNIAYWNLAFINRYLVPAACRPHFGWMSNVSIKICEKVAFADATQVSR